MKVSIVVPIYNAEKYLTECIESVLRQTNLNWELILVDDGSTDGSYNICNEYLKNHKDKIKVFQKKNEGQFLTRLYGIYKSEGDYIGFLDADDCIDKKYMEQIIEAIENNDAPDVICFEFEEGNGESSKKYSLPETGNQKKFTSLEEKQIVYKHIIDGKLSGSMWSKVFKAEIIKNLDIDKQLVAQKRFGEDAYHSFSLLAEASTILYLRKVLYNYRVNTQGASKGINMRELNYFETRYVFEIIRKNLVKWEMDTLEYINILCARNFNETVYHMLNYYRGSKSLKRKKEIIEFDWNIYLMDATLNNLKANKYLRISYVKVWEAFQNKKYCEIFLRETFKNILGW